MNRKKRILSPFWINLTFILICLAGVNIISSLLYFRLDLTEDKLYTLSDGTKNILKKIEEPLRIKMFFSSESEKIPLFYKNYGKKVLSILREYQSYNSEQISFEVFNPKADSDEEVRANRYGLTGADLGLGEQFFLGAVFVQGKAETAIPFFDLRREKSLEYDITRSIYDIALKKGNSLGILTSLSIFGNPILPGRQAPPKWALIEELEKFYEVTVLSPGQNKIPDTIQTLLVLHPQNFGKKDYYAIDQFVLSGRSLAIATDPFMRMDPMAPIRAESGERSPSTSDFSTLAEHWGIQYEKDKIIGDAKNAQVINGGMHYPYYIRLSPAKQNTEMIAVQNLEEVLLGEAGSFQLEKNSPLKATGLLRSSDSAGEMNNFMAMYMEPQTLAKNFKPTLKNQEFSAFLFGKLTSVFKEQPDGIDQDLWSKHLSESKSDAKIFWVTDVDFLSDQLAVKRVNLFGNSFYQPINDNLGFFMNMIDFLGNSQDMIAIRSRGTFNRTLKKFEEMQSVSQEKFNQAEEALQQKLTEIQNDLRRLKPEEGSVKIDLTPEQIQKINEFKQRQLETKQDLRQIRKLLRADIESLQAVLSGINLGAVPLLVTIFGIVVYLRRAKKTAV